jgi:hypothetical protein
MRALKILVVVMGVMIIAGVVILGVTVVRRMSPAPLAASAPLDEPAGTHIAQVSASGDRVVLLLQGGGPDRLVVLDLRNGAVVSRAGLAH